MATVRSVIEALKSLNLIREASEVLQAYDQNLAQMVKDRWRAGRASDSMPIGQYASRSYAYKKAAMNPEPGLGFMDLILEGVTVASLAVS